MSHDNPFADASVRNAQNDSGNAESLPTSQPFPGEQAPARAPSPPPTSNDMVAVSVQDTTGEPEWKRKKNAGETLTQHDLQEWEADLRKRELSGGLANSDGKPYNWPCWPKPCTRIAIEEDIVGEHQEERRRFVKLMLYCWYANLFCLMWNFICMCAYVAEKDDNVGWVFLAMTYWGLGSFCSFYLWFKVGYRAVETSSNFLMFLWLGIFGLCSLFWAACAVGVPDAAMAGFVAMIKLFDNGSDGAAIMCLLGFAFYCALCAAMLWIWWQGKKIYSGVGGTEKTKETADQVKAVGELARKAS